MLDYCFKSATCIDRLNSHRPPYKLLLKHPKSVKEKKVMENRDRDHSHVRNTKELL